MKEMIYDIEIQKEKEKLKAIPVPLSFRIIPISSSNNDSVHIEKELCKNNVNNTS